MNNKKGVITSIIKDSAMPVDADGNRADVIKFAKATIARMNPGQLYEQFISAASRDLSKWIRANYTVIPFEEVWNKLIAYYEVVSPIMYKTMTEQYSLEEDKHRHIESIITSGIYLYIPPDSPNLNKDLLRRIEKIIKPTYGPVMYVDLEGKTVTTTNNAFIGIQQMIVLEKTDQQPMAVSSGVLQHHGLVAGPNKLSRQGHPSKVQAFKVFSETEVRLYFATMGGKVVSKMLTMANSPEAHKATVAAILASKTPSNLPPIQGIVSNTSRPLMYIKHILGGFGLLIKENINKK